MKFVTLVNFTDQGIRNIGDTTQRAAMFTQQAEAAGIQISELLWLNGRFDGLIVYDAPDVESASTMMLKLAQSGNVNTETLPAFDAAGMQNVVEQL